MGPQSGSCGYVPVRAEFGPDRRASMGPQSGSCGYMGIVGDKAKDVMLQWVHSLVAVVIPDEPAKQTEDEAASMGPQSGSCGYHHHHAQHELPDLASMGPQSGSCGYSCASGSLWAGGPLQWVHSLVAVVILAFPSGDCIAL